jgi:hypothetical protein
MTTVTLPEPATAPSTTVPAPRRRSSQRLPDAGNARTWWIIGLMVSAFSFCVVMHLRQSPYQLSSKPIESIYLGDNVPGVNPGEADDLAFGTTVDRESWRHVRLTGQHSSGALIEIDLLRPQSWLHEHNATEGAVIPVEFGRIGIVGPVKVESISECPEIRAGPGKSVTGIYRHHEAPTILDLTTSNGERIGVTPDHRFWSEDQHAFIPAGELSQGETLKLLDGTTTVTGITTRTDVETVYTLEVQVEHVYHIAQSGILVHNCSTGISAPNRRPIVIGENMDRVSQYADDIGGHAYRPWKNEPFDYDLGMSRNKRWLQDQIRDGREIIDIGPDFRRRMTKGGEGSPFYEMERRILRESQYDNYQKVFERFGQEGGVPGFDF